MSIGRSFREWIRQLGPQRGSALQFGLGVTDQAVASLTNFLSGVLIGRLCSPEQFGLYALGLSVLLVGRELQQSLLAGPYTFLYPGLSPEQARSYGHALIFQQIGLCLILALAAVGLSFLLPGLGLDPALGPVLRALALAAVFILGRELLRRMTLAWLRVKLVLALDLIVFTLQMSGLGVLAWLGLLNAGTAFLAVGGACALGALCWFARLGMRPRFEPASVVGHLRRSFHLAGWMLASAVLSMLTMNLYPWLLATFQGMGATGLWAGCTGILALVNPLYLGLTGLIGPKIALAANRQTPAEYHQTLGRYVLGLSLAMLPLTAFLALFGGVAVAWVYGADYGGQGLVMLVLALNVQAGVLGFIYSRGLFALGRADLDFWVNLAAVVPAVLLAALLVRHLGLLGAALGQAASMLVLSLVRYRLLRGQLARKRSAT